MKGAPTGSVGAVSQSGWTDSELFLQWLKHFADDTKCSKTDTQLIIVDGHHSYTRKASYRWQTRATLAKHLHGLRIEQGL